MANKKLSLADINSELDSLALTASNGEPIDGNRLDVLLAMRMENDEYQEQSRLEHELWMEKWGGFLKDSVHIMRGYIPHTIFGASPADMDECLPHELVKRIFQKQCLWLVRMDSVSIGQMHESMLFGNYNPEGHELDVIELSAVYSSLPESFVNDHPHYKKMAWKDRIELRLKNALRAAEPTLRPPREASSAPRLGVYVSVAAPYEDRTSTHTPEITRSVQKKKKSFEEVCRKHSILGRLRAEHITEETGRGRREQREQKENSRRSIRTADI